MGIHYDPALEATNCSIRYLNLQEIGLNKLADAFTIATLEMEIIQNVINKLTHAQQKNQPADFAQDDTMRRYITHIHKNKPTIFDECVEGFPANFDPAPTALTGSQLILSNYLDESLQEIDMSNIQIPALNKDQIGAILLGLDQELKTYSTHVNHYLMQTSQSYEKSYQMTDIAQKMINQDSELKGSMNRRMVK